MNERQARQQGLTFTGAYSHNKEEMKTRAKEIRDQSFRAVVCTIPHNPLSRGHGGEGYSVYACERWAKTQRLAEVNNRLKRIPAERQVAIDACAEILTELANTQQTFLKEKEALEQFLNPISTKEAKNKAGMLFRELRNGPACPLCKTITTDRQTHR